MSGAHLTINDNENKPSNGKYLRGQYQTTGPPVHGLGCFRKCLFGIPRNTEFYAELTLFRVIPRNSAKFFTVQYREIPRNSAEFRIVSCTRNSVYLQMKIQRIK